jgi:pRiA4b ORF-3-like protein
MIVSLRHTLSDLADAIDLAFARWDLSHLHMFEFGDDRYMPNGDELETAFWIARSFGSLGLSLGSEFVYVFDPGDNWTHRCRVESADSNPAEEYGEAPRTPVPIWGWGSVPTNAAG